MMTAANSQPRTKEADEGKVPTVSSLVLLAGRKQLIIRHGREQYRLLLTSSNKLILTK
jgi:hemin uptake protein HemP